MAILKGNNQDNNLIGGASDDSLYGYGGNDNLLGGAGNDSLKGGDGADVLIGGDGNDNLNGGSGVDTLVGGAGDDIYFVDNAADVAVESANGGVDTLKSSISWTLGDNFEKLRLTGADNINGTGNGLDNTVKGNDADNVLSGGAGDDVLVGGLGVDTLLGGAGNDNLKISDFNGDVIDGGTGDDSLQIMADNQTLDLRTATNIQNIEAIRLGDSHSTLIVDLQSVLDLSGDSDTLKVDASGNSNTLKLDGGWTDDGIIGGYHTFTQDGATLQINTAITDIVFPTEYLIFDSTSAANVGSIFDSSVQDVTIAFGGKAYSDWGVSTIDLSGFGLEDKLIISMADGAIQDFNYGSHHTVSRSRYASQSFASPNRWVHDRVSWQAGATVAKLVSNQQTLISNHNLHTYTYSGSYYSTYTTTFQTIAHAGTVQLTGLPAGLADSHFVFV